MLLYRALFLSSVIFNSQAWRNLTTKDFADLQRLQLKLLKKIVDAPSSISSSFLFLELGVLPIQFEIQKRQITFLHHIVNLDTEDPVRKLYEQMKQLPGEANWYNDVQRSAEKYGIDISEEKLRMMSKDSFKKTVKSAIEKVAFEQLKRECSLQTKTSNLDYEHFRCQPYLTHLYPSQAKVMTVFKVRPWFMFHTCKKILYLTHFRLHLCICFQCIA